MKSRFCRAVLTSLVELLALDGEVLLGAHQVRDELLVVAGGDRAVLRAHAQLVDRLDVGVGKQRRGVFARPGRARRREPQRDCSTFRAGPRPTRDDASPRRLRPARSGTRARRRCIARRARRSCRRCSGSPARAARLPASCRRSSIRRRAMGSTRRATSSRRPPRMTCAIGRSRLPPAPDRSTRSRTRSWTAGGRPVRASIERSGVGTVARRLRVGLRRVPKSGQESRRPGVFGGGSLWAFGIHERMLSVHARPGY